MPSSLVRIHLASTTTHIFLTAAALFWLATLIRAYSTEIAEAKPSPPSTLRVTAMRVWKTKDFNNKIREELREKRA